MKLSNTMTEMQVLDAIEGLLRTADDGIDAIIKANYPNNTHEDISSVLSASLLAWNAMLEIDDIKRKALR